MKEVLDLAAMRADDAELFSVKVEKYPVHFAANKLKSIKSQLGRNISLRIKKKGRLGFSSDSSINDPSGFVDRAINTSLFGPKCLYNFNKTDKQADVQLFDPRTVTYEVEDGVEMGRKIIDRITKKAPDTYNDVKLTRYFLEVTYMSGDIEKTFYKTLFTYYISNMNIKEDGFIYMGESDSSCKIPTDIMKKVENIIARQKLVEKAFEMPSKHMPVIFHPKAVRNLITPLTTGLSGINLVSETSPLTGRINDRILDERFSLTDDGALDFGSESEAFDGEGLPRKRLELFDKGVLKNYLLDMYSASHLEMEPNGCANRGIDSPPSPSSSNLIVATGKVSIEDMIANIKDGLIVEEVIGGGQSNVIAGEFSMNVSLGFRIREGKLLGRVRNTMIAGNVYDLLLKNLEAMGKKAHCEGGLTTPYIMFKDLSVSGKE